jgi:hypothetical protein
MTQIVKQGIDEGTYDTPYPQESFEFVFNAAQFMLDPGLYKWTGEELLRKVAAVTHFIEIVLGAKKGCFEWLFRIYEEMIKGGTYAKHHQR